jgi:hypothetical protein
MKGLYAALFVGWTLVALGACTRPCKEGTVFLRLRYASGLGADRIQVTVRQAGTQFVAMREFLPQATEDSIEIGFPGGAYPAGAALTIDVLAEQTGRIVGGGQGQVLLAPRCSAVSVTVIPGGGIRDGAVPPPPDLARTGALSHGWNV